MQPVLERIPAGGRVMVIRLRSLGDSVLTTPALDLLHAHRPDLAISVVVEPRFRAVFEENPAIRQLLDPSPAQVALANPNLVINFHGGTRSAALTLASRAPLRAGFGHFRAARLYNVPLPRAQQVLGEERPVHTAEHLASAMFYLGVRQREIPRARLYAAPWPHQRPYAVIHPFASAPEKAWPAADFAALARALPYEPVILCGPADDPRPFDGFRLLRNAPLAEVKSAIRSASLFIGNDSGPAHIAAAFDIPLVVLFGPSDPAIWAPWKATAAEVLVRPTPAQVTGAIARLGVAR